MPCTMHRTRCVQAPITHPVDSRRPAWLILLVYLVPGGRYGMADGGGFLRQASARWPGELSAYEGGRTAWHSEDLQHNRGSGE